MTSWGAYCQKASIKGILVLRGEISGYKHTKVKSNNIYNFNFLQGEKEFNSSPLNGQSDCPILPDKNRRNKKLDFNSRNQGDLRICMTQQITLTAEYHR